MHTLFCQIKTQPSLETASRVAIQRRPPLLIWVRKFLWILFTWYDRFCLEQNACSHRLQGSAISPTCSPLLCFFNSLLDLNSAAQRTQWYIWSLTYHTFFLGTWIVHSMLYVFEIVLWHIQGNAKLLVQINKNTIYLLCSVIWLDRAGQTAGGVESYSEAPSTPCHLLLSGEDCQVL